MSVHATVPFTYNVATNLLLLVDNQARSQDFLKGGYVDV